MLVLMLVLNIRGFYFIMKYPRYAAAIPKTTEPIIYKKNSEKLPLLIKSKFSFANAENVVNPPQNPDENNNK